MTNDEIILIQLEELADRLGIVVRDENINIDDVSSSGGLCLVEGKYILILNSKTSVQEKLGYASTTATFSGDAWYYISSTEKQVAFFTPTVQQRSILAVYFDKGGKVTATRHYALAQGHLITLESRTTPARGRELTFLQQLLNATPAQSNGMQQTNPGGGGVP